MESVSKRQVVLLAIALVLETNLVSLPSQIIGTAKVDSWLSYVLAMGAILFSWWLVSRVMARFPEKDLFGILTGRLPVIGRLLACLVVLLIFVMLVRDIRVLTEFVNITLLPATPLFLIALMIVVSIVLTCKGGIIVIARMMELWLPLFLVVLVCIPFLLYSEFEMRNLFPPFNKGLLPPIQGAWYAVGYIGEIMLLPFLFNSGSLRFKEGFLGLAIGTGLLLLINGFVLLSMGVNLSGKMLFPLYETVRLIRATDFLDRFDTPYILIFLPLMITKAALVLYAFTHGIKRIVPALSMSDFLIPLGVWCFVSSFWFFQNSAQLIAMNRVWPAAALIWEMGLPVLFFLILRSRKKDAAQPERRV